MRRAVIPLMQLLVALAIVPACNDGGTTGSASGSSNPGGDDDDDGTTPGDDDDDDGPVEPYCEIVWISPGSATGTANLYVVELPQTAWTTGTKTFGTDAEGLLIIDEDENTDSAADYAAAVAGSFELTVSGTTPGSTVSFSDADAQDYDGETATGVANGGTGTFEGTLVDPDSEDEGSGTGTIEITYGGSAQTLGSTAVIAYCATGVE